MQKESILNYAGDLSLELEEIEKLIPDEDQVESAYTHTFICAAYMTIRCC